MNNQPDIQTNRAGLIRVRFAAPSDAPRDHLVEQARRLARNAGRAPMEFLYSADSDGDLHDLLFAGPRPN